MGRSRHRSALGEARSATPQDQVGGERVWKNVETPEPQAPARVDIAAELMPRIRALAPYGQSTGTRTK